MEKKDKVILHCEIFGGGNEGTYFYFSWQQDGVDISPGFRTVEQAWEWVFKIRMLTKNKKNLRHWDDYDYLETSMASYYRPD